MPQISIGELRTVNGMKLGFKILSERSQKLKARLSTLANIVYTVAISVCLYV